MISDFTISQIKAYRKVFPNALYNGCFFRWSQAIYGKNFLIMV